MLVVQQVAVLPAGVKIVITDEGEEQLKFTKSEIDGSLIFNNAWDADLYNKVYSLFRCAKLNAYLGMPNPKNREDRNFIYYSIEVRG